MILFLVLLKKKKKKKTAVPALYSIDSGWQQFWTSGTSQLITTSPQGTEEGGRGFTGELKRGGKKKKTIIKDEKEEKNSSPPARSSQGSAASAAAYAKALWWLCRDQRTLGAQTAGPDSPRIMEILLIFLMYSVITDICRQCVCASGG